jgi:predicted nuclease of predicted toxin-antitoxin system
VSERIRYHLDEHIDPVIATALRRLGVDVTTTVEAGLRTTKDDAHLRYAHHENRVIVTHDEDFLLWASSNFDHPGIAYCHVGTRSIGQLVRSLHLIYEVLTPEDMRGRVEYL